jgi:predicted RNA-binding Zn-ribbon protein involved in translation (DUF1610 family)
MKSNDSLLKSLPAESGLSRIREVGLICNSCGEETCVRISDSTLRGVPQLCPGCQAQFGEERDWLIASLDGLAETVNYSGRLKKVRIILRPY